ncbi:MAG TPA: ABC transporter permease [Candidatus Methylomirabilis sp.]|nr:ABC transporter permease [Candidatus Methylomirabilis sp.]
MPHEWWTEAWLKVKALVKRRRLERDLAEELAFHLAKRAEKNRRLGLGADDAQAAARRRFGNVALVKEDCREMWIFSWAETLWKDIRYAARILAKSPGFAAVVIFSLALGIGANTAVFSAMNAVLLRALPYEHPEALATVWTTQKMNPGSEDDLPPIAEVTDWKKENHVFADIAGISVSGRAMLTSIGEPGPVLVQWATQNFFDLIGVQPALGRVFRAEESQEQFQTVVISNAFWRSRFNSDPNVLGKTFRIDGVVSTVVGVMPAGFTGFAPWYGSDTEGKATEAWQPINPGSARNAKRSDHWIMPVARLMPGVTVAQAQVEMDVIALGMEQAYPESNKGVGEKVIPLYDTLHKGARNTLYPLLGAVGFVLLVGCVNVANLMLSRTEGRRKEYSVRASLGASLRRLMQQLLVECGLLTFMGGSLGVLLSYWGTRLMRAITQAPEAENIRVNGGVLLFAAGLSVLAALLFGLAPALRAARPNLSDALREGESRTSTGKRGRTRYLLVISEVALAMVLLVGAGLMINSLLRMLLPSPGFDATNVLTMAVNLPATEVKYDEKIPGKDMARISPKVTAFHQQLLERVGALPGVESVGMISIIPPLGAGMRTFSILGHPAPSPGDRPEGSFNEVSPSYFRTMKIPLKKGRYFDERDTQSAPWALIISETFASRYFPNEDPIGQQMLLRYEPARVDEERPRQIVGVVGEVKQIGMGGLHPLIYESYLQQPDVFEGGSEFFQLMGSLVIRTTSDVRAHEADITTSVKQFVKEMDPDQPVTDISTMEDVLGKFMKDYKNYVVVLGFLAGIAVVLAAIGVYGVLSYFVNQRTRELGIRFALGAQRGDVLVLVAKLGLSLAGTGLAIGVALTLGLKRFLAEHLWLFHVKATDPATYAAVGILLVSIALLACYIPARRATNVDPMTALRHE